MFRNFRRFLSNIFPDDLLEKKMASTRYFPNTMPDFSGSTVNQIPSDILKKYTDTTVKDIESAVQPIDCNGSNGLYLGTAGISYMYYHLSKNAKFSDCRAEFLSRSLEYLTPALNTIRSSERKNIPSLILGNCGVYAVASAIYTALDDKGESEKYRKMYYDAGPICKDTNFLHCGSDELFVGRAGYVLGALWLSKETGTEPPLSDLYTLCNVMVESGRKYAQKHHSSSPLMYSYYRVEYLGAAHGLCTILQALISVPGYLDANPAQAKDVKSAVDYLLSLQNQEGNFPYATDEIGGRYEIVHWCHGAAGMIYLMAKAYLIWNEAKYLQACEKMGELIWIKGLLRKGPGICHGVAGNGYAFLLLYRLTEEPKHLHRADSFAQFIHTEQFVYNSRTPDYPFSLYEGLAGTACFLGDLIYPKQAAFPFSDIF